MGKIYYVFNLSDNT